MSYLEELLPEFRKRAKIRCEDWEGNLYIYLKDGIIYDEENNPIKLPLNDIYEWFYNSRWELYKDPEPDWQYIIDHKCLCYFWNGDNRNKGVIDYLVTVSNESYKFYENTSGCHWSHCRPVRRDEIIFYEDKADEKNQAL